MLPGSLNSKNYLFSLFITIGMQWWLDLKAVCFCCILMISETFNVSWSTFELSWPIAYRHNMHNLFPFCTSSSNILLFFLSLIKKTELSNVNQLGGYVIFCNKIWITSSLRCVNTMGLRLYWCSILAVI